MRREEAIEIIKEMQTDNFNHEPEEIIEALDMAIKALEQEPCEDCISRKDLIKSKFIIPENEYEKTWNDVLNSLYKNLPSVQPISKSVIEDIKSEVCDIDDYGRDEDFWIALDKVIDIIDKHIAESEE